MNWTSIIIAIIGLIEVGALLPFFFIRVDKKKKNAEADNTAIEGYKSAVADLREDNARLRAQLIDQEKASAVKMDCKDKRIAELFDEKDHEREGRVTAEQGYCRHFGCVMREPAIGQGREWLESHKGDPALGIDYLPINMLLKRYGQLKKEEENGTQD